MINANNVQQQSVDGEKSEHSWSEVITSAMAAELCCGLLFATHKNASIGAAQSVLFMCQVEDSLNRQRQTSNSMTTTEFQYDTSYLGKVRSEIVTNGLLSVCMSGQRDCLDCVLLETLRLTAHSIGAIRRVVSPNGWDLHVSSASDVSISDTNSKGGSAPSEDSSQVTYHLPFGAYVAVSHITPHLQASWDCSISAPNSSPRNITASQFYPERFLSSFVTENQSPYPSDDYIFTTFSHGVHKCPGNRIAYIIMRLLLEGLLRDYDVLPCGNEASCVNHGNHDASEKSVCLYNIPDVSFERATLAQRRSPVYLTLKHRIKLL